MHNIASVDVCIDAISVVMYERHICIVIHQQEACFFWNHFSGFLPETLCLLLPPGAFEDLRHPNIVQTLGFEGFENASSDLSRWLAG